MLSLHAGSIFNFAWLYSDKPSIKNTKCPSIIKKFTAWEVSKYGVCSGPYFPVFGLSTGQYGPGNTPYLDTFHAVVATRMRPIFN